MISAPAARGGVFKRCCLKSGRYDGALRNHYFQGLNLYGDGVDGAYPITVIQATDLIGAGKTAVTKSD